MSSQKNRLEKLEKKADERTDRPEVILIYGTRPDGVRYLIQTWSDLVQCNSPITDQGGRALEVTNEQP